MYIYIYTSTCISAIAIRTGGFGERDCKRLKLQMQSHFDAWMMRGNLLWVSERYMIWMCLDLGFPLLVLLHMAYSAIFAKLVMPIFTIHASWAAPSEFTR